MHLSAPGSSPSSPGPSRLGAHSTRIWELSPSPEGRAHPSDRPVSGELQARDPSSICPPGVSRPAVRGPPNALMRVSRAVDLGTPKTSRIFQGNERHEPGTRGAAAEPSLPSPQRDQTSRTGSWRSRAMLVIRALGPGGGASDPAAMFSPRGSPRPPRRAGNRRRGCSGWGNPEGRTGQWGRGGGRESFVEKEKDLRLKHFCRDRIHGFNSYVRSKQKKTKNKQGVGWTKVRLGWDENNLQQNSPRQRQDNQPPGTHTPDVSCNHF